MTKTLSGGLATHVALNTTTLAVMVRLTRVDGQQVHLTAHDKDILFDLDVSGTDATYSAESAITRKALRSDDQLSVNGTEVSGAFTSSQITEQDLKLGFYKGATYEMFFVNWADLSQGKGWLSTGTLGQTLGTSVGSFFAELRGLTQAFSRRVGELVGPLCVARFGDARCNIPLRPAILPRETAVVVGDFYRVRETADPDEGGAITVVNGDFETDTAPSTNSITGWTINSGDTWDLRTSTPFEGVNHLSLTGSNSGVIEQIIELRSGSGGPIADALLLIEDRVEVKITMQGKDFQGNDTARLTIRVLDSSDVELEILGFSDATTGSYTTVTVQGTLPANTAKLQIQLEGIKGGATIETHYDIVEAFWKDTAYVAPEIPSTLFNDRIFSVTVAGTTAFLQPVYDQTVGNSTVDGTATLLTEHSWARAIEVTAVDGSEPNKKFTVTELTPNTGGPRGGFADGWFELGAVVWESGNNVSNGVGAAMEVRDYTPDDGITITQDIELFLPMAFAIEVGDKARIYPGCDLRRVTCITPFDNIVNMRAGPFTPGSKQIGRYPDAKSS